MMRILDSAKKTWHFFSQKNGIYRLQTRDEKCRSIGRKPDTFLPPSIEVPLISLSSTVRDFLSANPSWNFRCIQLEETRLGSKIRFSANECEIFAFITFLLILPMYMDESVPDHAGA
jgi:hypothetical protein